MNRWLSLAKRRNFYYKLVTYTLLLSLLPIFVMSFVFYQNTNLSMQRELQAANANYLQQTVNAMEIMVRQIYNSFQQFSLDDSMRDFEKFPRGLYYESISGEYGEDDLPVLYQYLSSKSKVFWILENLKKSNSFIHSVYFLDSGKRLILTSEGLQYPEDRFYDEGWLDLPERMRANPMFLDVRNAKERDGGYKQVIPLIYVTTVSGNYLAINLDAEAMYKSFVSRLDTNTDSTFFILSASGKPMLYDPNNALRDKIFASEDLQKRLKNAALQSFESEISGKRRLVTVMTSETLGWTFVTAVPLDKLYRSVSNMKGIVMLTSFLLILATGFLAFLTSRNMYTPIYNLIQFIKNRDQIGKYREFGELNMIRSSLEEAYEERERLQVRLKESMPAYQEIFVRSLLREHALSREEIAERMRFLGFDIGLDGLMLMVVSLETEKAPVVGIEHVNLSKLRIIDRIESIVPPEWKRIVMELSEGMFVVIMNCSPDDATETFVLAEQMIRDVKERLGFVCTIGIGNYCADVYELRRAFEEAQEALRFRTIAGAGEVIYIEDVRLEGTPPFVYPKDKEAALVNCIINGEADGARRVFADMMRELKAQQGKVHYHQVQHAFMQLLSKLAGTANDMRLDLNRLLGEKGNLYSVLLRKHDMNEVAAWFEEMISLLTAQIGNAFREKNNRHVDQVMQMVERHIGEPISLTFAADRLRLNPSYLSRIFKEKTGQSFSEYVTRTRMERSKQLLTATDMKIKEIGESVGYHKTNYFIKLFKEYTGLTPGEYRKMHAAAAKPLTDGQADL